MDPTGLKGCRRLSIKAAMTSSKVQDGGERSVKTRVVVVILSLDHRNLYMWMKVTTHTCGIEILSPTQYACVVDYACAVANLVYKRSAIPTRFRKNGLTGNRTRTTCMTGRDTKPLYCQPFLSRYIDHRNLYMGRKDGR